MILEIKLVQCLDKSHLPLLCDGGKLRFLFFLVVTFSITNPSTTFVLCLSDGSILIPTLDYTEVQVGS